MPFSSVLAVVTELLVIFPRAEGLDRGHLRRYGTVLLYSPYVAANVCERIGRLDRVFRLVVEVPYAELGSPHRPV
jgi:hypothetical protein